MTQVPKIVKQKRTVVLCFGVEPAKKGSGRVRLWAFSVRSLAELLSESEWTVRKLIRDKAFDPTDLASIVKYASQ